MTLEELLSQLGYAGSPCFLKRGDERFETELGYGHIFRRAQERKKDPKDTTPPRWRAEGVYGVREMQEPYRFTPIVYVCTAPDDSAANELHRLLWNQDVAPYIIVRTTKSLAVYSGFNYGQSGKKSESSGVIQALTDFDKAKSIVNLFHRRQIDEGQLWKHPEAASGPWRPSVSSFTGVPARTRQVATRRRPRQRRVTRPDRQICLSPLSSGSRDSLG